MRGEKEGGGGCDEFGWFGKGLWQGGAECRQGIWLHDWWALSIIPGMVRPFFTLRIDAHVQDVRASLETVTAGDLAEIIRLVERALVETAQATNADLSEAPVLSVVGIAGESNALACAVAPALIPAVSIVTQSIADSDFSVIPPIAQKQLHELQKVTARRHWTLGFEETGNIELTRATISPEVPIPESPVVHGETTVYGEIIRVGGKRPKVQLRLVSGEVLTSEISRPFAEQLASRLYTEVGLEGEAIWDTDAIQIVSFRVSRVLSYRETPITEAFRSLYGCGGSAWAGIGPNDYVGGVRGE